MHLVKFDWNFINETNGRHDKMYRHMIGESYSMNICSMWFFADAWNRISTENNGDNSQSKRCEVTLMKNNDYLNDRIFIKWATFA